MEGRDIQWLAGEERRDPFGSRAWRDVYEESVDGVMIFVFTGGIPVLACCGNGEVARDIVIGIHVAVVGLILWRSQSVENETKRRVDKGNPDRISRRAEHCESKREYTLWK